MEPKLKKVATAIVTAALINYTPINVAENAHVKATIVRTEECTATILAATAPLTQMPITTLVTAETTHATSITAITTTTPTRTTSETSTEENYDSYDNENYSYNEDVEEEVTKEEALDQTEDETDTIDVDYSKIYLDFDMDVSKPSALSRNEFISVMSNMPYDYYGYFARNAGAFWDACHNCGVNEFFACGITAWESGWGQCDGFGSNNYFGIVGGSYDTEAEGVKALVELLAENYLSAEGSCYNGTTITAVGSCYCDPYNWPSCVYGCMQMMA